MRTGTGIAGATLLFEPRDGQPDLVLAMQYLVDDLRGEGRRIAAMKLTPSTLRLRSDPFELILTLAQGPVPATSMQGLLRPRVGDTPDFARVHIGRTLRLHSHAMGFLVRRRGAPIPDLEEAMLTLAHEGQFCLLSVMEAATPSLLVWQPGSLVLTSDEFKRANTELLLTPGDASAPLSVPPPERLGLMRPDMGPTDTAAPSPFKAPTTEKPQGSRAERHDKRSLGKVFGKELNRPPVLPRLDRSNERITAALRGSAADLQKAPGKAAGKAAGLAGFLPFLGAGGMS